MWNPTQIASVEGAELAKATTSTDDTKLKIHFPELSPKACIQ